MAVAYARGRCEYTPRPFVLPGHEAYSLACFASGALTGDNERLARPRPAVVR